MTTPSTSPKRAGPRSPSARTLLIPLLVLAVVLATVITIVAEGGGKPNSADRGSIPTASAGTTTGGGGSGNSGGSGGTGPSATTRPHRAFEIGAYTGPGAFHGLKLFSAALGKDVRLALDYVDDGSWSSIADPVWTITAWRDSGLSMELGVPLLPSTGASLAQGAAGRYDSEFSSLGATLVASGHRHATLVLGWSPERKGLPWTVTTMSEASAYRTYWQRVVTTMRAVKGADFRFVWEPGSSGSGVPLASLFPGRKYVDAVGVTIFDQIWGSKPTASRRWRAVANAPLGPRALAAFARSQHEPLTVTSFGLVPTGTSSGGGDDPAFVRDFFRWAAGHRIHTIVVWDYGSSAISTHTFPRSLAAISAEAG